MIEGIIVLVIFISLIGIGILFHINNPPPPNKIIILDVISKEKDEGQFMGGTDQWFIIGYENNSKRILQTTETSYFKTDVNKTQKYECFASMSECWLK